MRGDTSISGKKIVEESVVESSGIWGGEVLQDGLGRGGTRYMKKNFFREKVRKK